MTFCTQLYTDLRAVLELMGTPAASGQLGLLRDMLDPRLGVDVSKLHKCAHNISDACYVVPLSQQLPHQV